LCCSRWPLYFAESWNTAAAPVARQVIPYQRGSQLRGAERSDRAAYNEANVRMVLATQATRTAFEREGAGRICDFAI